MDKLSQQELIRIRRGAEDAIQAMNRNHKSFIDAVSHPLNIIALVDMAQSSIGQQAKVEELQRRNQMLSDSTLEMGSKHIRDTDLINQQASTLFRLREFIYGSGDLREYSDEELLEHQRILKVILTGEQALKGEG